MVVESLAASVVANFLLPYVKEGLTSIADKVAEGAGKATADQAESLTKQVWERVRRLFSANQEEPTLDRLQRQPDKMAPAVEVTLDELLEKDPEARLELEELVGTTEPTSGQTITSVIQNSGVAFTTVNSTVAGNTFTVNQGTQR